MPILCNIDALGLDEMSMVVGYLDWKGLLRVRVCQKWRDAVKLTQVPRSMSTKFQSMNCPDYFIVNQKYALALSWIVHALPRLQTIHCNFQYRGTRKFDVKTGEDPFPNQAFTGFDSDDSEATPIPPRRPGLDKVDLSVVSRFRDLRELSLEGLSLDGTYGFLFNFPQLESLILSNTGLLRWDFSMLSGLPKLKRLECMNNTKLTGDLEGLQVVGQTLVEVNLCGCGNVEGSIMSLSKFPHLEELSLLRTKITGDIRDIGDNDFVALKKVDFGGYVYGGGHMDRIEDAADLMLARYRMKKRSPSLFVHRRWSLIETSPQHYGFDGHHSREPPFYVEFVEAGPRLGWRWTNCVSGGSCESHWLDPEPDPIDPEYEVYLKDLEYVQRDADFYKGFNIPPTQMEHDELNRIIPLDPILRRFAPSSPFVGFW
ncbi:unnamed protein product [Cylindrotheca closterium]|uniref:F-box domain-containing protein n=1 Tax=Cylindrotheca closterium TaxID=2856 RepID=A0AAD2CKA3_9STRA|nr:unnamed protein product [Cylindrotheca closterium]